MALTKFIIQLESQKEKNQVLKGLAVLIRKRTHDMQTLPESRWRGNQERAISREIHGMERLYEIIHSTRGSQK